MKTGWLLGMFGAALALAGCNGKDEGNVTIGAAGKPVAAVAAPAGTRWSETVAETPEGGYRMGNPDAAIKLIEYASYTCPHCRDFAKEADDPLAKDYVDTGKVSFEFRSFVRDPLDLTAAMVARCGGKDIFFPLSQQMFQNQDAMFAQMQSQGEAAFQSAVGMAPDKRFVRVGEIAGLIDFAKQRGVPEQQVRACLADSKRADAIAKGNDIATKEFNVQGTPTIIMNGKVQENIATWPQLKAKLTEAGA